MGAWPRQGERKAWFPGFWGDRNQPLRRCRGAGGAAQDWERGGFGGRGMAVRTWGEGVA